MDLPAAIPFSIVTAWLTQAVADSADEGKAPDMIAMVGTVTLTPNVIRAKVLTAMPQPMTVFPRPIVCEIDSEGFLLGPDGTRDVTIVATGEYIPSYTALFNLEGVARFSTTFLAPADTIVDLVSVLEVPLVPSEVMEAWTLVALRAEAAAQDAKTFPVSTPVSRPESPVPGQTTYALDLGLPLWFNGTDWYDAVGTVHV